MSNTPRRTIRMSDEEWAAGHAKAQAEGETLTEVLRRLLATYLVDNAYDLDNYGVEYRAVPKDASLTAAQREELTVESITGRYENLRRIYPAKHWHIEKRDVSPYRPVLRTRSSTTGG